MTAPSLEVERGRLKWLRDRRTVESSGILIKVKSQRGGENCTSLLEIVTVNPFVGQVQQQGCNISRGTSTLVDSV